MTKLDRVGYSDNFNFKGGGGGGPSFLQVCKKRSQASRKKMGCLHNDCSATYL